jgi:hypothetical protein
MSTSYTNARIMIVVSAILVILTALPNLAEAMRCGSKLLGVGDSKAKVLSTCGEPTTVTKGFGGNEIWMYNFGVNRQLKELQFKRDRVESIRDKGSGYGPSPQPGN